MGGVLGAGGSAKREEMELDRAAPDSAPRGTCEADVVAVRAAKSGSRPRHALVYILAMNEPTKK
jgi:hypothetical protein